MLLLYSILYCLSSRKAFAVAHLHMNASSGRQGRVFVVSIPGEEDVAWGYWIGNVGV